MISPSHHGVWRGPNRLWFEGPTPERSEGTLDVATAAITYTWSFRGKPQQGRLELRGPGGSVGCAWKDSWHAAQGMDLHGHLDDRLLVLYCTYPAAEDVHWGWRIEVDTRDPEHFTLRMWNLEPGQPPTLAVDLAGARP